MLPPKMYEFRNLSTYGLVVGTRRGQPPVIKLRPNTIVTVQEDYIKAWTDAVRADAAQLIDKGVLRVTDVFCGCPLTVEQMIALRF